MVYFAYDSDAIGKAPWQKEIVGFLHNEKEVP